MAHENIMNILYSNFIRYDRMYNLVKESFQGKAAETNKVNIYLDMNSLTSILYRYNDLEIGQYSAVTSSMINLCAHIREYFWTRHRTETAFYIVYSPNLASKASIIKPEYNAPNLNKIIAKQMITDIMMQNVELLEIICPYLQDIYFIYEADAETAVVMYNVIGKVGSSDPNIIFTKDQFMYQLVATMPGYTFIFRPKKLRAQDSDVSWVVTKNNLFRMYQEELGNANIVDANFSHMLFSLVVSIAGFRCRNLSSSCSIGKAIKIIQQNVDNKLIINGYNSDIDYIISNAEGIPDATEVTQKFLTLDLLRQLRSYELSAPSLTNTKGIINLYDPDAVRAINNKYFRDNPLDLNRI